MESHAHSTTGVEMGMGGSSTGTHSGSRWSPTKEQISILENLFEQGIRTPTAEQIQKITTKLRAYGHIEGKNVFYWFQNHKARQRQKLKQKQETIASCFNRVNIHTSHPIFSPPLCPNDVYWLQQNGINYCYSQQPNVLVAGGISPRAVSLGVPAGICYGPQIYEQSQHGICDYNFSNSNQETLTLFPLHPTGILEAGKTTDQFHSLDSISIDSSFDIPSGSRHVDDGGRPENKPLIDFFTSIQESRSENN